MTSSGSEGLRAANENNLEPSLRPLTASESKQAKDLHWAATAPEVQKHIGKVVVIHNKRVVAVGMDRRILLEQAAAQEQCPWTGQDFAFGREVRGGRHRHFLACPY